MLCVGEGGVGKSSMLNYLLQANMVSPATYEAMNRHEEIIPEVLYLKFFVSLFTAIRQITETLQQQSILSDAEPNSTSILEFTKDPLNPTGIIPNVF